MAANEAGTAVGDSVLLAEEGSRKRTMAAEAREEYDDDDDLGTFGDGANAPFSLPSRTLSLSLSLLGEMERKQKRERGERRGKKSEDEIWGPLLFLPCQRNHPSLLSEDLI